MISRQTANEAFIQRMTVVIEENMKNDQFGVSDLATKMGISRSNLYLKVHTTTQKSARCFIRETRLQKALKYMQDGELNVSETAYEVGFSSPAYFVKCFHDYYGFPPGEIHAQKKKIEISYQCPNCRPASHVSIYRKIIIILAFLLITLLALLFLR